MLPTDRPADSWRLAVHPPARTRAIPGNLNAIPIFQGLPINQPSLANPCAASLNPGTASALGFLPNQQQFQALNFPQSVFLNQNYLNPSTFLPLGFQPFGYPQSKNFVYAYSQQANITLERDLGHGYALSLAYNFNGGRHLNRPINANTIRGDLMVANFNAALAAGQTPASPFTVSGCGATRSRRALCRFLADEFLPPRRPESVDRSSVSERHPGRRRLRGPRADDSCKAWRVRDSTPTATPTTFTGCVPFGDMDANYSNGSSIYHGFTANLRKRFSNHYEFLASYTWSHAIDDSTDLQSTLTPQDSYYPGRSLDFAVRPAPPLRVQRRVSEWKA